VRVARDDLTEMQATDPSLPSVYAALARLRAWLAEREVAR